MGTIAGRYQVTAKLGEGGMGVVFRAYDPPPMDREVAVKTLHEFTDPLALELFYKECSALKSISHPNIVEIFDMGEFEEEGHRKPYFVMPLLPGQTLDKLIKDSSHRLTVERVVEIFAQTCRGLQAAHEHGLVHRDLKPSNVFVMADDSVKIIDFGVAHAVTMESRSTGFDKGTLLYMAPEQVQHKPVSVQSDIYSLGVTLYEALTRRQPFRAASEQAVVHAILTQIPPPASDLNPAVSHAISRVVHKAMAKQPWNRFDTARELGDTLQKAARNEPIAIFDPARTQPRIQTAMKALDKGDYQFAAEIVGELEAEGNIDPQITLLRTQIDQIARQKTIAQLLESARARYEEEEDPLALSKLQEVLQLDPTNVAALGLKSKIEDRRSERQIEKWIQLARQHVDNHSYGHAREALQNALVLRPKDPRATKLLKEIEGEEQEYVRLRREKTQMYESAVNAWKNGEISQALSQMRRVLDLDVKAPDASSPDAAGAYQSFFDKVRSEHDAMNAGYADAKRHLAEKRFADALRICTDFLAKYPNQALFQALKFDIDEQQRQQLSAFIAEVDRRLEAEPDLEAKVALLREAVAAYPDEEHFRRLAGVIEDKRTLVNSIVERARVHEAASQISEALADLDTLRTIYGIYPGLSFERERLQKRLEQQTRDAARTNWARQIDAQLEVGNYARAHELLDMAEQEFAGEAELAELRKLAVQGQERLARADQLVADGQQLCAQGDFDQGVDLLKIALQLDDRPAVRQTLRDLFVTKAQEGLDSDWRTVEAFAERALELDPDHALAKSLRAQALDRKREEDVPRYASQARRLQAAGDLTGAMTEVEKGLSSYPGDPRLSAIADAVRKELDRTAPPPAPAVTAPEPAAPSLERTRLVIDRRRTPPEATAPPEAPTAAPMPTPAPVPAPKPAPALRPRSGSHRLLWGALAGLAVVLLAVVVFNILGGPGEDVSQAGAPVAPASEPAATPPPATPAAPATPASLALQQLPPGLQVSFDGAPIGTVGSDGAFSYSGISPGPHTLLFSMPGFEPLTLSRDFADSATLTLSPSEVTLKRSPTSVEFIADPGTRATIVQSGKPIQQFTGQKTVPLAEGTYEMTVTGPAGVPTTIPLSVPAGGPLKTDLRPFVITGMEQFDQAGWTRTDNWYTRRGGTFVLYNHGSPDGKFTFTVRLDRSGNPFTTGSRFNWVVGYIDNRRHVRLQLDEDNFYRTDVVDGIAQPSQEIPHRIRTNVPFIHVGTLVSGAQLVTQFSTDGTNWQTIDTWIRTTPSGRPEPGRRTMLDGKFGFFLPGEEQLTISNFRYYPSSR
ncbi:MAG TPA: protein kinase [Vicinamibacterales bacterium]|nr:protein kinase [Vicinamibacterales bacterium]